MGGGGGAGKGKGWGRGAYVFCFKSKHLVFFSFFVISNYILLVEVLKIHKFDLISFNLIKRKILSQWPLPSITVRLLRAETFVQLPNRNKELSLLNCHKRSTSLAVNISFCRAGPGSTVYQDCPAGHVLLVKHLY